MKAIQAKRYASVKGKLRARRQPEKRARK